MTGSRAAQLAALIFLFAHFGGPSAGAMGLCDCCSGAALTTDCQSACASAKEEIPMCRPVMIYDGDAGEPPRDNALAVASLKYLSMGRPDRPALDRFRQWFELWRSRAEAKFQAALARHESGEDSDAEFAGAEAERDQVLVNYQHGMQRYSEILRAGRHKRVIIALAAAQSAKTAVPASVCHKKLGQRALYDCGGGPCRAASCAARGCAAPRGAPKQTCRSAEIARQKIARQKIARQEIAQQRVAQQQVAEQKVVRVAVRIAKVCTGNWVNAACAAP